uniref:Uncharacterized protein n=1 Tax=Vitis vinifera TaxID=29760 RepID=A5B754_VITVI|nr:hypothetical protein VITISV_028894 [Vitis vinifera]
MNFMGYVAEVSRGWDEPNARDMGRMTSQPNAKGEMYILNDGIDMKAEIAAMERRLDELEMNQMQEVQAISQTPLQAMPCAICLSYEHLVEECPTIPAEREMLGDCNTYNSNWRDHPNFSWKPQPPQYQQPAQAPQQASNLEQAMVNLCKVVGDFVGKQEATNARVDQRMDRVDQRIDRVESTLNKRMDEMQNDLSQKLDILQDSISRLSNLNTVQEKENSPSQPYQNSMSIHEMEAEEGKPSQKKEIEEVITLRSGKEVDLPTCKLEHKVDSETEKENREEIKGKKKGKSTEKDDYIDEEPQRIVIKKELMKKHMPPPFLQALYEKIIQRTSQGSARFRSLCEIEILLQNQFAAQLPSLRKFSQLRNHFWHTSATSQHSGPHFAAAKAAANHQSMKSSISQGKLHSAGCETHCEVVKADFATKVPFRKVFRGCEAGFGTRVPFRSTVTLISQLRNGCEMAAKFQNVKNPNFTAAPISATVGHISITSRSSNYAYDISFQSLGSQESIASNGMRFGGELKKLWSFEDKRAKLNGNFATETPFGRVFRSCETTFWHTSAICSTVPLILKLRYTCEITFELRNHF